MTAPYLERVLAVDPGKTTGIALLERRRDESGDVVAVVHSHETQPDETIPCVRELLDVYGEPAAPGSPRMRVVCESFKITARTGELSQDVSWALRTQGALEQACRDYGYPVEAIKFQGPDKKKAFPNPRLKKLGLWHVGGHGHALDAIRHAVLYLSQTGMLREVSQETP